jgi:hypothetical protein
MDVKDLNPLINDLASSIQNKVGFDSMPTITLQDDEDNAQKLLGKTAYYEPHNRAITVYVTNRHPKDILRSIAHEFIHHGQNLRGEFDNIGAVGEGYAQNDEHLRSMEEQAYKDGNMCFRDWEDGYKRNMMESIHRQNSFKRRTNTMRIHKWKNNELNSLLMEKFNLGKLTESNCSGNRDMSEKEKHDHHKDLKEGEKCPECGYEKKGKMEEGNCMGSPNRGEKCPECGKVHEPMKEGEYNRSKEEEEVNEDIGKKSVEMGADDNPEETRMDHLPDEVLKNIAKKKGKKKNESFRRQVRKLMEETLKLK